MAVLYKTDQNLRVTAQLLLSATLGAGLAWSAATGAAQTVRDAIS